MENTNRLIKAVIFDFGGVLMRTESQEPRQKLARQVGLSVQELYHLIFDSEESHLVQLGRLSPEVHWQRVGGRLGKSPEEMLAFRRQMFAADVLDRDLVYYIRRLRGAYKTALLSNASARLAAMLRDELHIDDCFDVITISAQVGLMKPDPDIYKLTLDRLQVAPPEAIFVDDAPVNVAAAAVLGMHAILFTGREALLTELQPLLKLANPLSGRESS